ncbi:MAG TPA: hypothetical protein DCX95_06085 [Elusimicrobia bacterium]|nr:hypothetical protein [Elusimicrobiota bacterium]
MKTVLLHTCCGPCGFSATKFLSDRFDIKYYWYNPNIQPFQEYEKRLNVARQLFSLVIDDYAEKEWLSAVKDIADNKNERCIRCYRVRLTKTAKRAKELKTDFFTTTLLISPYQHHDVIKEMAEEIASTVGLGFYYYDGRPDFYKNYNEFKKTGFYTQKYCGCLFGKNEK